MIDKAKLGQRYTCFECGTKFYDLNRPEPLCPECGANQENAPITDFKALLSPRKRVVVEEQPEPVAEATESEEEDELDGTMIEAE